MLRECPYCAEKIQKKARVCRFCSAKVEPIYVENNEANRQICKIMAWHSEGNGVDHIVSKMNESGEKTLDTKEPWTSDRVNTVITSFSGVERKVTPNNNSHPPRNNTASGNLRTEQRRCFCQKCNSSQDEVVTFVEGRCNHVLHGIITLLTFFWGIAWLIIFISSQNETKQNRRLAISQKSCNQCGGDLILMNE